MDMNSAEGVSRFYARICHYEFPEQLFGDLGETPDEKRKTLAGAYKYLIRIYHPDLFASQPDEHRTADNLLKIINYFREEAERRIDKGVYGTHGDIASHESECVISTSHRDYRVIRHLVKGDESDVYLGEYDDAADSFRPVRQAAIKIASDRSANSLLENEVIVLRQLNHQSLPELIDHFVIPGEGKKALVLGYIEGYDFYMLRERFPDGVPDKHLCWILERLLSVLGFMHYNAVLHGNIEPGNIMVRPRDHNAFLIDFNYSLIAPEKGERLKPLAREFTAPEVFARMPPHPASDLYSLGKCMLFLAGGDVELEKLPALMDPSLASFIQGLLVSNPSRRSNDAWKLHGQLSELRQRVFGARHEFLPFDV